MHWLIDLHIVKENLIAIFSCITVGVHKEGRFAGLIKWLWHVDLVYQLIVDKKGDTVQVATDADAVDIVR